MSDLKRPDAAPQGLLARWSARKARVREAEQALEQQAREELERPPEQIADAQAGEGALDGAVESESSVEHEPTDEDMPPIESLDERSDLSVFFSSKVSEDLRRRALRKVFLSAAFNRVDGLDDYAEDFTTFEPLGDIVTSDIKHQLEMARERLAAAEQQLEDLESEHIDDEPAAAARPAVEAGSEEMDAPEEKDKIANRESAPADAPDDAGGSRV